MLNDQSKYIELEGFDLKEVGGGCTCLLKDLGDGYELWIANYDSSAPLKTDKDLHVALMKDYFEEVEAFWHVDPSELEEKILVLTKKSKIKSV